MASTGVERSSLVDMTQCEVISCLHEAEVAVTDAVDHYANDIQAWGRAGEGRREGELGARRRFRRRANAFQGLLIAPGRHQGPHRLEKDR